jgi:hypothetical protein
MTVLYQSATKLVIAPDNPAGDRLELEAYVGSDDRAPHVGLFAGGDEFGELDPEDARVLAHWLLARFGL